MLYSIFLPFFQTVLKKNKSKARSWKLVLNYLSLIKYIIFYEGIGGGGSSSARPKGSKGNTKDGLFLDYTTNLRHGLLTFPSTNSYTFYNSIYTPKTCLVSEDEYNELRLSSLNVVKKEAEDTVKGAPGVLRKGYYVFGKLAPRRKKFIRKFNKFILKRAGLQRNRKLYLQYESIFFEFRPKFYSKGLGTYSARLRPVHLLLLSIDKVTPLVTLRVKKSGLNIYRVPRPLNSSKGTRLALRWLFKSILVRKAKKDLQALTKALIFIQKNEGSLIQSQKVVYKLAIQNRPFVRYLKLSK